jgi:hypothetical protein
VWRATIALAGALALGATGCGDGESSAGETAGIATGSPERTFAPLIQTAYGADHRPVSARWFVERSTVATADSGPYAGRRYRDLRDGARGGPPAPERGSEGALERTPVYFERHDDGDSRMRISYWALYGMHAPDRAGAVAHEGDWQRVDVILDRVGDDRYLPRSAQLDFAPGDPTAPGRRELRWRGLVRHDRTHLIFINSDGDHRLEPSIDTLGCGGCIQWRTWTALSDARAEPWAGFDGPWGEVGATVASSGPLGPTAGDG